MQNLYFVALSFCLSRIFHSCIFIYPDLYTFKSCEDVTTEMVVCLWVLSVFSSIIILSFSMRGNEFFQNQLTKVKWNGSYNCMWVVHTYEVCSHLFGRFSEYSVSYKLKFTACVSVYDIGSLEHLLAYESERQRQVVPMMGGVDCINRLYSNRIPPVVLLRNIGCHLTHSLKPIKVLDSVLWVSK